MVTAVAVHAEAPPSESWPRARSFSATEAHQATAARPVFKLYGHEERLHIEHPDCEHDFPPEMRQLAYQLFDRVLKP